MILRSLRPLLYDSRANKSGIIDIVIDEYKYNRITREWTVFINEFEIKTELLQKSEDPEDFEIVYSKIPINTIPIIRKKIFNDVDNLFLLLGQPINPEESLTDSLENLVANILLRITIDDDKPLYGSIIQDWVIIKRHEYEFEN